jgi:GT2 family glycosyltransferase
LKKKNDAMFDVSVVIVNFNSQDLLIKCLDSVITGISRHTYEIIVVDNYSSDGSAEMVKKTYPRVKMIENPANLGFIKANNIGIRASSGKYILCLNNDTVAEKGAIDKLAELLANDPKTGAVGPKLLNADGSIQKQGRRSFPTPLNSLYYFSGLSRLFPDNKAFGAYLLTFIDESRTQEVDCLCGAAMMVKKETVADVGLMDEAYFMYGDDIDWCIRIKRAGWKIYYVPSAVIVHYGGMGGSRQRLYRNVIEFYRAMAIFYSKHYKNGSPYILNLLVFSAIWLKCGASLLANLFRKEKFVGTKKP